MAKNDDTTHAETKVTRRSALTLVGGTAVLSVTTTAGQAVPSPAQKLGVSTAVLSMAQPPGAQGVPAA